jgi:hypothetical protein
MTRRDATSVSPVIANLRDILLRVPTDIKFTIRECTERSCKIEDNPVFINLN